MKCPQCQSENVQNIRLVYESGTATLSGSARTGGVGYTPGVGTTYSTAVTGLSGKQSSLTAQRHAPPAQKKLGCLWWLGIVVCATFTLQLLGGLRLLTAIRNVESALVALLFISVGGLALVGLVALIRHRRRVNHFNRDLWPTLYEDWTQKWLCHRCGYFGKLES